MVHRHWVSKATSRVAEAVTRFGAHDPEVIVVATSCDSAGAAWVVACGRRTGAQFFAQWEKEAVQCCLGSAAIFHGGFALRR